MTTTLVHPDTTICLTDVTMAYLQLTPEAEVFIAFTRHARRQLIQVDKIDITRVNNRELYVITGRVEGALVTIDFLLPKDARVTTACYHEL